MRQKHGWENKDYPRNFGIKYFREFNEITSWYFEYSILLSNTLRDQQAKHLQPLLQLSIQSTLQDDLF